MKKLEVLTKRVEQLEEELKQHGTAEGPTAVAPAAKATAPVQALVAPAQTESSTAGPATGEEKIAPFSDWDWTWLNGNPRNKDVAFDSKFSPGNPGRHYL